MITSTLFLAQTIDPSSRPSRVIGGAFAVGVLFGWPFVGAIGIPYIIKQIQLLKTSEGRREIMLTLSIVFALTVGSPCAKLFLSQSHSLDQGNCDYRRLLHVWKGCVRTSQACAVQRNATGRRTRTIWYGTLALLCTKRCFAIQPYVHCCHCESGDLGNTSLLSAASTNLPYRSLTHYVAKSSFDLALDRTSGLLSYQCTYGF